MVNPSATLYRWDGDCSRFGVGFLSPGVAPSVALASFEGSGNTWLRFLLEGMTGVFTGDIYYVVQLLQQELWHCKQLHLLQDDELSDTFWGGRRGVDCNDGTTFAIKTHK